MKLDPLDKEHSPLLLVGLTGGIACGKTSVSGMLRELGTPIIDADELVHLALSARGAAVEPIVKHFGSELKQEDGGIDRAALADRVFDDEDERRALESIVHPMVTAESRRRIEEIAREGAYEFVVYDAALLVETGRHDDFHRLIVVTTTTEIQFQRLVERSGLGADEAGARIRAQMPLAEKESVADYVIDNSRSWRETREQVADLHQRLLEDAALHAAGRPLPPRR